MPTFKHLMICFQFLMYLVLSNSNLLKTIGTYMISAICLGYTCLVRFFFLSQYVPCYCRQQVTSSIYRWKEEAFQEEGKQRNPVLITNEDLSYEIYITDEPNRSKIHGPGWEKLIRDYDLHYRDLNIINLDTGSLSIEIDLRLSDSRAGHRPLPKPSLGKCTNFHPVLSTTFISIIWYSYPCPLN